MTAMGGLSLQKDGQATPEQTQIEHFLLVQNGILPPLKPGEKYMTDYTQLEAAVGQFQGQAGIPKDTQTGAQTWAALFGAKGKQLPAYNAQGILGQSQTPMTLDQAQALYAQLHPGTATSTPPATPTPTPQESRATTTFTNNGVGNTTNLPGQTGSPPPSPGLPTFKPGELQRQSAMSKNNNIPTVLSSDLMTAATKQLGADGAKALNDAVATDPDAKAALLAWIDPNSPKKLTLGSGPIQGAATMMGSTGAVLQIGGSPDPKYVAQALKSLGKPTDAAPQTSKPTYFPPVTDANGKVSDAAIDAMTANLKNNAADWVAPMLKDAVKDPAANQALLSWIASANKTLTVSSSGRSGAPVSFKQDQSGNVLMSINASAKSSDVAAALKDLGTAQNTKLDPRLASANEVSSANSAGKLDDAVLDQALAGMSSADQTWAKKILHDAARTDPTVNKLMIDWADSSRSLSFSRTQLPNVQMRQDPSGAVSIALGPGSTAQDVAAAFKALGPSSNPPPKTLQGTMYPPVIGQDGLIRADVIQAITNNLDPTSYAALLVATRENKSVNATIGGWINAKSGSFSVSNGGPTGLHDDGKGNITLTLAPGATAKDIEKLIMQLPTT